MKVTKKYLRSLIKEEISSLHEVQADSKTVEAVKQSLSKAPGLAASLDKITDEATAGAVLDSFVAMLTAKGMNKSKLINMLKSQVQGAQAKKSGDVGAKGGAAAAAKSAPAAPAGGKPA